MAELDLQTAVEGDHQHGLILAEALRRDCILTDLSDLLGKRGTLIEWPGGHELLVAGIPSGWIVRRAEHFCDRKQLSKLVLERLQIPFPRSIAFEKPDQEAVSAFMQKGQKYVFKPQSGTNGIGVVMDLENWDDLMDCWESREPSAEGYILEEQLAGEDIRIQVLGGKIVAACVREPAFVLGDGALTVEELV